jgi:flagellar basal-body rod protein FlgC
MDAYDITASALTAQRLRLDTISSNLANVNTTRKADGSIGAYHRKNVVFAPIYDQAQNQFAQFSERNGSDSQGGLMSSSGSVAIGPDGNPMLKLSLSDSPFHGAGVKVMQIVDDNKTPMRMVYDPSHPDANKDGYVELPNINVVTEMVDMISASRAYEANVTALQSAKAMHQAALDA